MTETAGQGRDLHFNVSQNNLETGLRDVTKAIANGFAPRILSMAAVEFDDEGAFRKLILAMSANTTIQALDLSAASLPCDASEETCEAIKRMFLENKTLQRLDISGAESRLETSRLGEGILDALLGLKYNTTLQVLHIRCKLSSLVQISFDSNVNIGQKLGSPGASALAEVLETNVGLVALHCENNAISLRSLTEIVEAVKKNTTLTYMAPLEEDRQLALKLIEDEVKRVRDFAPISPIPKTSSVKKLVSSIGITKSGKEREKERDLRPRTLSNEDIKSALTIMDENWSYQTSRLNAYLQRNYSLAQGIPTPMDTEYDLNERYDNTISLDEVIEKVKLDSTPTAEKQLELALNEDYFESPSFEDTENTLQSDSSFEKELEIPLKVSPVNPKSKSPPVG
jgi:hypothetical protein